MMIDPYLSTTEAQTMKEALQAFVKLLYISLLLIGSIHALTAQPAASVPVRSVDTVSIRQHRSLDTYPTDKLGNITNMNHFTIEKLYQDAL